MLFPLDDLDSEKYLALFPDLAEYRLSVKTVPIKPSFAPAGGHYKRLEVPNV